MAIKPKKRPQACALPQVASNLFKLRPFRLRMAVAYEHGGDIQQDGNSPPIQNLPQVDSLCNRQSQAPKSRRGRDPFRRPHERESELPEALIGMKLTQDRWRSLTPRYTLIIQNRVRRIQSSIQEAVERRQWVGTSILSAAIICCACRLSAQPDPSVPRSGQR